MIQRRTSHYHTHARKVLGADPIILGEKEYRDFYGDGIALLFVETLAVFTAAL